MINRITRVLTSDRNSDTLTKSKETKDLEMLQGGDTGLIEGNGGSPANISKFFE